MRRQRIKVVSTVMMVLVAAFCVVWTTDYCYSVGKFLFFTDWSSFDYVDEDFVLTNGRRALAFLFHLPSFVVSVVVPFMRRVTVLENKI